MKIEAQTTKHAEGIYWPTGLTNDFFYFGEHNFPREILQFLNFPRENSKTEDRFFLWRPLVFAPILPYENGDLKKKRSAVSRVVLRSAGAERECGWKYIVFGQFGLRISPLSAEH